MQIAVFGSKEKPGNEREKESARAIGYHLARKSMGPLLANVDSSLAHEAAWGARKHSDRMIIIGTLPAERSSDPKKISSPEKPYSATYFTDISNKIRSCFGAIFIGNGPDVLEALLHAHNHAHEGFVIGIFDDKHSLSKELVAIAEKSDKKARVSVVISDDPATLVTTIFNEIMRFQQTKDAGVTTAKRHQNH